MMSRRAGLCAEAFRTRERAPPRAPGAPGAPQVLETALPAHHESSESDDIPEEPQSSMPSAPEASSASAAKAARRERRKKRLREEKDIEAFLAQAAREAQSEFDLLPLSVIHWLSAQLQNFLAYVCHVAESWDPMKDISSDSPFVSKWRSQRLRSEQWTAFEKTLAEVRRAVQTQPQLLPQFELLADELHDSFVNNRDSFRAEAFDQDLFLILQENLLTGGRVRNHLE